MNRLLIILMDLFVLHTGYVLTFLIRYGGTIPDANFPAYLGVAPWLSAAAVLWFYLYGLYDVVRKRWAEIFSSLTCVVGLLLISAVVISFIARQFAFPRTVLALSVFVHIILLSIWRYLHWRLVRKKYGVSRVVVVGEFQEARHVAGKLADFLPDMVHVLGIIDDGQVPPRGQNELQVLGAFRDGMEIMRKEKPDAVYLCSRIPVEIKKEMIYSCLTMGIEIYLVPDLYEILLSNAVLSQVDDTPVFHLKGQGLPVRTATAKRVFDVLISLGVLAVTAPLMLLTALLIKIDSPGPIFYRQERLSEKGQTFLLYKFRSMRCDAEKDSGPVVASEHDPRVTRVGRFLRHTRLDELPQFINVLKGEMSVIGPRPERPYFVERFSQDIPDFQYRMEMKAGITGLAQVSGKYSTDPKDKLRYDLIYAKKHSALMDFTILLHTIKVMLMGGRAS